MQRRSTGVQGLIFGGLMAALVVVFALIPGLAFLMPIPLVLVSMRHGGRAAVLSSAVAVLMTMAFRGVVTGILAIPAGVLPGLVFGIGFRRNWKSWTIGLSAVAAYFVGYALTYVVLRLAVYNGRDPIEMMFQGEQVRQFLELMTTAMEQALVQQPPAGATPEQLEAIRQSLAQYRENPVAIYWTLLPSILFLQGAVSTWVNWLIFRWTLPRFGYAIPQPVPLSEFRLPLWLVWVFGLVSFLTPYLEGPTAPTMVDASWEVKLLSNVTGPLGLFFALAGFAVAYGYLVRKRNFKPAMAVLMIILLMILLNFVFAFQLLIIVAMWDAIFDFRGLGHGLWKRPEENT